MRHKNNANQWMKNYNFGINDFTAVKEYGNLENFIVEHKTGNYIINCCFKEIISFSHNHNLKIKQTNYYNGISHNLPDEELLPGNPQLSFSMYGHCSMLLKYNDAIFLLKDTLANNNPNYIYDESDVYLDIETTGLNYLDDDIISLSLFQPSTNREWSIMLPLEKQDTISEFITSLNGITSDMIKDKVPLSQEEVNYIIDYFDLKNNKIIIWSGKRLFDATFLQVYFIEHNLNGIEQFKFVNVKPFIKNKVLAESYTKDYIAGLYDIDITESHTSLGDCKITSKICDYVNNNAKTIDLKELAKDLNKELTAIINQFDDLNADTAQEKYDVIVNYLWKLYGKVPRDYDANPLHKDGCQIHHIDETLLDNIAVRTQEAIKNNDKETLSYLKKYNRRDRLVYADCFQHFVLHCLIEKIRLGRGGGPHYLFWPAFRQVIGSNLKKEIVKGQPVIELYTKLLRFESLFTKESLLYIQEHYWKNALYNDGVAILLHRDNSIQKLIETLVTKKTYRVRVWQNQKLIDYKDFTSKKAIEQWVNEDTNYGQLFKSIDCDIEVFNLKAQPKNKRHRLILETNIRVD